MSSSKKSINSGSPRKQMAVRDGMVKQGIQVSIRPVDYSTKHSYKVDEPSPWARLTPETNYRIHLYNNNLDTRGRIEVKMDEAIHGSSSQEPYQACMLEAATATGVGAHPAMGSWQPAMVVLSTLPSGNSARLDKTLFFRGAQEETLRITFIPIMDDEDMNNHKVEFVVTLKSAQV